MSVRLSKTLLLAALALFLSLVALDNVIDYPTNYAFVQHVMAMDTTQPGNHLMWRSIQDPRLHQMAYATIILWEALTAAALWAGAYRIWSINDKGMAVLGLTMSLMLWLVGFTIIGGEWWMMWTSEEWNGMDPAARNFVMHGVVLLYVNQPES